MFEVDISMPRSGFSPREAARAGDIWRAFQEIAVAGSTLAGWSPARYREEGLNFILRSMVVRHHREVVFGEPLGGRTWPARVRRGTFFQRECRLDGAESLIAETTQQWVCVSSDVRLTRGPATLVDAFPVEDLEPSVDLPEPIEPESGATHAFGFDCWHTWADTLGHVNHPVYVDWCDEAIARRVVAAGDDPVALQPVAEKVDFLGAVAPGVSVRVETEPAGRGPGGSYVFAHRIFGNDVLCAKATTHRISAEPVDLFRGFQIG